MSAPVARLVLSAGRGPGECAWAVACLTERLEADAARSNVAVRRVETVPHTRPGTMWSVLLELTGETVDVFAARWVGTLCWQAPSPFRLSSGRKNWYVTCARLNALPAEVVIDERDVVFVATRAGGPGGQHRNKVATAVRATHSPTGWTAVASAERSQRLNRKAALQLLRTRAADASQAARAAAVVGQWRLHDQLVRGNPVRTERP